jgi:hypothetical protein
MRYEENKSRRRRSGALQPRGAQTGLPLWGMFLFGLPFLGAGTAITLIGLKVIAVNPASVNAPYWVLTVAGLSFFMGGVLLWSMGWRQFQSQRRGAEARQQHPGEPALADNDWNPRGCQGSRWPKVFKAVTAAIFLTVFLSLFNWWAFLANGPWMVKAMVVLFDLFLVAVWGQAVLALGRALKFGGSRIEFTRFPYRVSEPVVLRWQAAAGIHEPRKGAFTLRCVEEWYEASGSGRNRSRHLVHEEVWSGAWQVEQAPEVVAGKTLELRFSPPADAPGTALSATKPVFWELEVKLDLPGFDFVETYLVPVYGA